MPMPTRKLGLKVPLRVSGVVDNQPALAGQAIDEDVVDDTPGLVAVERVVRLADRQRGHVEGRHRAQQPACLRPLHPGASEVRDIEDADALAHGMVLCEGALVLERHLPADEGCKACAQCLVPLSQSELTEPASAAGTAVLRHTSTASHVALVGLGGTALPGTDQGMAAVRKTLAVCSPIQGYSSTATGCIRSRCGRLDREDGMEHTPAHEAYVELRSRTDDLLSPIGAAEFKSRCLHIIRAVAPGRQGFHRDPRESGDQFTSRNPHDPWLGRLGEVMDDAESFFARDKIVHGLA